MNKSVKTYDARYDILKFFLSILVVAIHSGLYPSILYPWLRIAVPLFFIMTSFFFFKKTQNADKESQKFILKSFVIRNAKLYCFWFVLLLPVTIYINFDTYFKNGILMGIFTFLRNFFLEGTFVASWYIPASVGGILIVYFLSKSVKPVFVFLITFFAFCIVTLWSSYKPFWGEAALFNKIITAYSFVFGNPLFSFPASLIWIFIGKLFAQNNPGRSWKNIVLLIISSAGLYAEWLVIKKLTGVYNNDSYFMLLPVCFMLFRCLQASKVFTFKYAHYLRHASTVIYVLHGSLIRIIGFALRKALHTDSTLLLFISALASSIAVYIVIEFIAVRFSGKKIAKFIKNAY